MAPHFIGGSNELLWLCLAILDMSLVLVLYRLFGRAGLLSAIVLSLILCNVQVLKTVQLFGLTTTLGNILYGSVFLATDLLGEVYGKAQARRSVYLGFAALLAATALMQMALTFPPDVSDFADPHLQAIFGFLPRVAAASLAAYLLSQLHDVWAFHWLKKATQGRHLWLRNNASTLISQLIDSMVFCFLAFAYVFPWPVFSEILLTTYLMKVLVAVMDTPFLYLARAMNRKWGTPREFGDPA